MQFVELALDTGQRFDPLTSRHVFRIDATDYVVSVLAEPLLRRASRCRAGYPIRLTASGPGRHPRARVAAPDADRGGRLAASDRDRHRRPGGYGYLASAEAIAAGVTAGRGRAEMERIKP
jgi:hypothetical protein